MKLGLKVLLLIMVASVIYANEPVNLDQAIDIALKNSPTIKVYREQVMQAGHTINLANAYYNPNLSGNVGYTRRGPKVETGGIVTSPSELSDAGVTVTMPIDIGGTMALLVKGSKVQYKSGEYALATSVFDLIKNVKTNYLYCLLYKENLDTAQSALNLSKDYLTKVKQEVEVGTKAHFDITRQEYDVATRENALVSAKGNYDQMINNFNYVLGKNDNFVTPIELVNLNVTNVENIDADLVNIAYDNRPELKKANEDLEVLKLSVLKEKKTNNPSLNLVGNYDYLLVNQTESDRDSWSATANLSIPIFDGGIQKQNTKIAESKVDAQNSQIEATKQGITTGVLNAKIAVLTSKEQIDTCESAVKLAKESYEIAKIRYEQNLGTHLDVSDALDSLVSAQNSLSAAKFSYAVNMCALEREIATTSNAYEYTDTIVNEINDIIKYKAKAKGESK